MCVCCVHVHVLGRDAQMTIGLILRGVEMNRHTDTVCSQVFMLEQWHIPNILTFARHCKVSVMGFPSFAPIFPSIIQ